MENPFHMPMKTNGHRISDDFGNVARALTEEQARFIALSVNCHHDLLETLISLVAMVKNPQNSVNIAPELRSKFREILSDADSFIEKTDAQS